MKYIDLHVHSTASDGTCTPAEVVALAQAAGLAAIALTDHDTIDGVAQACAAAPPSLEVIPGVECSTEYMGKDVHILGLYVDIDDPVFQSQMVRSRDSRDLRNQKMIQKLNELGISLTWDEMLEHFGPCVWTRAHFAQRLFQQGYVSSVKEAFERYLGDRGPCYVPREKVDPRQTIGSILHAGGFPVLAHPILYRMGQDALEELVRNFKHWGGMGIETIYSTYSRSEENLVRLMASKYNLIITGGSDFHGSIKPDIALGIGKGKLKVPYPILENVKAAICASTD